MASLNDLLKRGVVSYQAVEKALNNAARATGAYRDPNRGLGQTLYDAASGAMMAAPMEGGPEGAARTPRMIDTPQFKNWFGRSHIVDGNGDPQVVYHGTQDLVDQFDFDHPNRKDSGWLGTGAYMTSSPRIAGDYASLKAAGTAAGPNVMPLYARLENPYYATLADKQRLQLISHSKGAQAGRDAADDWTQKLKAQGHDGVILDYPATQVGAANASREIVAFDPKAVKSATGNRGSFDPNSSNITRALLPPTAIGAGAAVASQSGNDQSQ